jgi:hypothetical protein
MSILSTLATFNWKRHGNTLIKVLFQPKVLGLIGLLGFVLYGIAWDTVLRPSLETMKQRDEIINKEREALNKKEASKQHYDTLAKQLHDLQIDMIAIRPGDSSTVLAVSKASALLTLANGSDRTKRDWPILPAPHDRRENVSLTPMGSSTVNIQEAQAANAAASAPPSTSAPTDNPAAAGTGTAGTMVERFDYTLKATGTYPALMDLLNELVTERTLIKINRVEIALTNTQPAGQTGVTPPPQPDAKEYPDYPVKLDMVLSLSLFLYAYDASAPPTHS